MLRRGSLSSRFMAWGAGINLLMLGFQLPATAVPTAASIKETHPTLQIKSETRLPDFGKPDLPPLGDPHKFLPPDTPPPINPTQDVRLVLKLGERRVYVYRKDKVYISYPVAVGKAGWETPTGNFKVMQMIQNPSWEHPWTGEVVPAGPDNPLGTRWIGFWTDGKNVIGFHGTPNPESIGRPASHGCVRMHDKDVQALFEKVEVGTPVIVEP